jgi:S1-C subfamily serine protease
VDLAVVLKRAPSAPLARVAEVLPGSRAAQAGLRPGDRVLRIGRMRQPSAATVVRMLADTTSQLLVYERDGTQRAVVLP